MEPADPQFNPEIYAQVFRGVGKLKNSRGHFAWGGTCPSCAIDRINDLGEKTTGLHWTTNDPQDLQEEERSDMRVYSGYTDKKNILSRGEVKGRYNGHGIIHALSHLSADPYEEKLPDTAPYTTSESPLRPGSEIHVTKTTHYLKNDSNPNRYPIVIHHKVPTIMTARERR